MYELDSSQSNIEKLAYTRIQVYLPTGTVVTIKPHDGPAYLNIWISAGSADYGKVQGEYGITRDQGVA